MLPPLPRCSGGVRSSLISPRRVSLPRKGSPGRPAHRPFRDPMTCCGWRLIPHQSEDRYRPFILELTMNLGADKSEPLTAIHTDLGAIFVSLELSRSSWLITSLSPGGGEKMSKHSVP